ncbi:MAG: hypothetical protein Kow0010_05320 [Dehalococcoidia bacterium]
MLRIGEVAEQTGLTPKTLRFYEEAGLLRPDSRSEAGYRLYREAAVERLRFIRSARSLGLGLDDIRQILDVTDQGRVPCEHALQAVEQQIDRIDAQIRRLSELRGRLDTLRVRMVDVVTSGAVQPGQVCPCLSDEAARGIDQGDRT